MKKTTNCTICSCKNKIVTLAIFLFLLNFLAVIEVHSQSTLEFKTGIDTLVVYKDVPGLVPSDKYTIRVRSSATNGEWVDVFANFTSNKADPASTDLNSPDKYQVNCAAWSHAYGNIEMNNGQVVEVEIAGKPGFKIAGKDFEKAKVHPAQKASGATLVGGKIYFTITKPGQIYIDINGQMDDFNRAINPIGHPVHVVTLFANPVIKKPLLTDLRVRAIETGTSLATINAISPASYDIMYFKPGVHDIASGIKMHPGKTIYIPGDAYIYGSFNNYGVPVGSNSTNGEKITLYGYGTICGVKIPHYQVTPDVLAAQYPGVVVDGEKPIEIENSLNCKISGVTLADNANHSIEINGSNNTLKWLKTISWRVNGDGLGGYSDAEDCFIRSHDDASYVKASKRRCTFWKDSNARLFFMAAMPENTIAPIIIEDCDVLYARLRSNPGSNGGGFTAGGGPSGQRKVNLIVRNIRVHDKMVNMSFFNLNSSTTGSSFSGILFQNISIAGMAPGNKQKLMGSDVSPWYGGLIFDNLTIGGTLVTNENYKTYFDTNEFEKNILFNLPRNLTLTTIVDATKGSVTRNIVQDTYLETSTVILNATGKPGYVFSHWSGDAVGTSNPISVVITKNMTITANFSEPNFTTPIEISAPGSGSFTVPANAQTVTIQAWGGGGAGGSASNAAVGFQSRGGGGAGAGYAGVTKAVISGQKLSYTLGAGGGAAPLGFANLAVDPVQNGGMTSVSLESDVIALAAGGLGGTNIAGALASGPGGAAPQTGNIGDIVFYGGNGAGANSGGTGGGGGSAGASGNGGNAPSPAASIAPGGLAGSGGGAKGGDGFNSTGSGKSGAVPGAGGSGAAVRASANNSLSGGAGSDGKLIISFTFSPLSTMKTELETMIEIYPNPVSDALFFNSKDKKISKVQLVDLTGKIVYSSEVNVHTGSINIQDFVKGIYLMSITVDDVILTKKIVIK